MIFLQTNPYNLLIILNDTKFLTKLEDVTEWNSFIYRNFSFADIRSVQNIIENNINVLISHCHGDLHVSHAKSF
jgi:hypothetical protein